VLKRSDETLKVLAQIQSHWPEWDLPYLVNGIILQNELKPAEAKQMLDWRLPSELGKPMLITMKL